MHDIIRIGLVDSANREHGGNYGIKNIKYGPNGIVLNLEHVNFSDRFDKRLKRASITIHPTAIGEMINALWHYIEEQRDRTRGPSKRASS